MVCLVGLGFYAVKARKAEQDWQAYRQQRIAASPKVYLTRTGAKYHRAYHYATRNYETSLYEATERHYDACAVCRPPGQVELLPPLAWYFNYWIALTIAGTIGSLVIAGAIYGKLMENQILRSAPPRDDPFI